LTREQHRERLLAAITKLTAHSGYAAATVGEVAAQAALTKRDFYTIFADKQDCFLAALADIERRLLARVRDALARDPAHASEHAIRALVALATAEPTQARVFFAEVMAGGLAALDARDHAIDRLAGAIECAYATLPPATPAPDISSRTLLGGVCRVLATRLPPDDAVPGGLLAELLTWIRGYEQPLRDHRWRELRPVRALAPSPLAGAGLHVAETDRLRLLLAAASLAETHGYANTTITAIARHAGLSPRTFYRLFADKQSAFAALHEHHFRRLMGVAAGAFFAHDIWSERIWEAGRACTQFMEQNPTIAHTAFIESYAGGPATRRRVGELLDAFTLFLQDGLQHTTSGAPPTRVAVQAIAATVFELRYRSARAGALGELSRLLPHAAFVSLAPFLGPLEANRFIDGHLRREAPATSSGRSSA
jgi:AcrR family transcriptional regulator